MAQFYNILLYPADSSGCGHYRMKFPAWAMQTVFRDIRFIDSMKLIGDKNFYRDIRVVRLQRQVADAQAEFFLKFLKPLCDSMGVWTMYEIDDVVVYDDLPAYNCARDAFNNKTFFKNVGDILAGVDFITVTSESLRDYYANKFSLPKDKFIIVPNYLPRWWINNYDVKNQVNHLKENKKKPRIVFPMSASHIDLKKQNGGIDDMTHITDFIRSTYKQYSWCLIGAFPWQLEDLVAEKKIEMLNGSDILNYPRELWQKKFQAIVAPLQDNIFNRCKSNIKLIEAWAMGIPPIVQDLECYSKYTDWKFKTADDLQNQLDKLFRDDAKYGKVIKDNRHIVDFGDRHAPNGYWIEKNLATWRKICTLPQKTMKFDIAKTLSETADAGIKLDLDLE